MQKQKGYNDCALFAIAFATTLCHGGDPTTKRYDQRAMRPHLVDCLESSRMTEFPPTDDTVELVHPVVGKNVPIYCTCQLPNNNAAYVKCCGCGEWYHSDFANIPQSAFHLTTKWLCFICPVNGKPFSSQVTLAARLETTLHWNLT